MPSASPSRLAAAALALGCAVGAASAAPAVIPLTLPSGKVLQAEVMVKDDDRAMGLMFRSSLPLDRGMLFVFDDLDFHGIWMKNCSAEPITEPMARATARRGSVSVAAVSPCARRR